MSAQHFFIQRPMLVFLRPVDIVFAHQNDVGPLTSGRDPYNDIKPLWVYITIKVIIDSYKVKNLKNKYQNN